MTARSYRFYREDSMREIQIGRVYRHFKETIIWWRQWRDPFEPVVIYRKLPTQTADSG